MIRTLEADDWSGLKCLMSRTTAPSTDDVEAAIRALDQDRRTICRLEAADGTAMVIGGGLDRFVVYRDLGDDRFRNCLVDRGTPSADGPVMIRIGGQEGDYDPVQVLRLDEAIRVAHHFASDGGEHPDFVWADG